VNIFVGGSGNKNNDVHPYLFAVVGDKDEKTGI